ncbi:MAG: hypothetical protein WD512_16855, partial [Candidatus Paceibacterota bacterium]
IVTGSSLLVQNAKGEITHALGYGEASFSTTNDEEKEILDLIETFQKEIMLVVDPSNILKFVEDEELSDDTIYNFYNSNSYKNIVDFAFKIKSNIIERVRYNDTNDSINVNVNALSINKNDQEVSKKDSVGTLIKSLLYDNILSKKILSFELRYICRNSGNNGTVGFDITQIEYIKKIARNNDLSYIGKYNEISLSVDELRSSLIPILRWKKLIDNMKASSYIIDEFKQKWNSKLEVEITENNGNYELTVKDKFDFLNFTTTF